MEMRLAILRNVAAEEFNVFRHSLNGLRDVAAQGVQRFLQSRFRHRFRYAMMAGWLKSLS